MTNKNILLLGLLLFVFSCSSNNDLEEVKPTENNEKIFSVDARILGFSRHRNCTRGEGNCAWAIVKDNTKNISEKGFPVKLSLIDNNTLSIDFTSSKKGEDTDNILYLENDITLPAELSKELLMPSITIPAGNYKINSFENKIKAKNQHNYGNITLKISQ